MRFLAVVVALFVGGCASSPEPLVFSYQGTPEGLQAALAAAGQWEATCGATIIVGVDNGGLPLVEHEGMLPGPLLGEVISTAAPEFEPLRMAIVRQDDPDVEVEIMAHEFGHALRIRGHATTGLMAERHEPGLHVTPADCALLPR